LIEAALEPARGQFKPAALRNLVRALALISSAPRRWWCSRTYCSWTRLRLRR
jgi:hypothetical protein